MSSFAGCRFRLLRLLSHRDLSHRFGLSLKISFKLLAQLSKLFWGHIFGGRSVLFKLGDIAVVEPVLVPGHRLDF